MVNPITQWLVTLMVGLAPPDRAADETPTERLARYESIARDLYTVAYDEDSRPFYSGPRARAGTAATQLAVLFVESGFARDVDLGPCKRGRCDGGRSACMAQIRVGDGATREGWTQADLFADRKKCFLAQHRLIRSSFAKCRANARDERLAAYASGSCALGRSESRARLSLARKLFAKGAPLDEGFVDDLLPRAVDARPFDESDAFFRSSPRFLRGR